MSVSLGLEHDAERRERYSFCLSLKGHFADEIKAELGPLDGHDPEKVSKAITELYRREREVYSGETPCPLAATCKLYRRAVKAGKKLRDAALA